MWVRFDEPYNYRGAGFTIAFKPGVLNVIRAAAEAAITAGKATAVPPVPRGVANG